MTTRDELKAAGLLGDSGFELTAKGQVWMKELGKASMTGRLPQESDFDYVIHGIEGIGEGTPERGDDEDFVLSTTGLIR